MCLTKSTLDSLVGGEEEWFVSGVNMCFDVDFSEEKAKGEGESEGERKDEEKEGKGAGSASSSVSGVFPTLQVISIRPVHACFNHGPEMLHSGLL